jgi:hypothetical protein
VSSRMGRIAVAAGIVVLLLVGGVAADRLGDDDEPAATEAAATAATETDPYPLSDSTTPKDVQTAIFERAYSECASTELAALAAKYKTSDTSKEGVAEAVGRGWASYFKAGQDSVQDGRDGCLQGQEQGSS